MRSVKDKAEKTFKKRLEEREKEWQIKIEAVEEELVKVREG